LTFAEALAAEHRKRNQPRALKGTRTTQRPSTAETGRLNFSALKTKPAHTSPETASLLRLNSTWPLGREPLPAASSPVPKDAAKACGQDHQRGSAEPEELITQHLDDHRGSAIHQQHFSYAGLL
jgi:hypothetical protein